jgi:enhancer of polycomb-like protein
MDTIFSEEDEDTAARLRQRWKFDQDDEPLLDPRAPTSKLVF